MKSPSVFIAFILIGLFSISSSFAQTNFSARLKKEIINIEASKYIANEFKYLTFSNGNTMQIKITATSPVDVMSRDNFINIYSTLSTMMLLITFAEAEIEIPAMRELDELIGEADITYNLVMTRNGIQIQVITGQTRENVTMTWAEFFEE